MRRVGRTFLASCVILVLIAGVVIQARQSPQGAQAQGQPPQGQQAQGQGRGAPPQNLKVLPKNWTRVQVMSLMRTFTAALGVQCGHCHAGTAPNFNYPAD